MVQTTCRCKSIEPIKTPEKLEPEQYIELYGVDHYVSTMFPYDSESMRKARKRHLLTFSCLRARQYIFETT